MKNKNYSKSQSKFSAKTKYCKTYCLNSKNADYEKNTEVKLFLSNSSFFFQINKESAFD